MRNSMKAVLLPLLLLLAVSYVHADSSAVLPPAVQHELLAIVCLRHESLQSLALDLGRMIERTEDVPE